MMNNNNNNDDERQQHFLRQLRVMFEGYDWERRMLRVTLERFNWDRRRKLQVVLHRMEELLR